MHARALALLSVVTLALAAAPAHGQRIVTRTCWAYPGDCSRSFDMETARIAREDAARERSRARAVESRERAEARTRTRAIDNAERAAERARATADRVWNREAEMRHERVERAERARERAADRAFERRIRYQRWD